MRVALNPTLELGNRDENELTREDDLEFWLHPSLEVVEADAE
jgi:hypothetical protein